MVYITAELRRKVIEKAGNCCEYCLLNQRGRLLAFEIDHVIAQRHRGETTLENLCLSCPQCNRLKGSDISSIDPVTNLITPLFHPRQQTWADHFRLEHVTIEPLTPEGRITVFLLQLNETNRVEDRQASYEANLYPCRH
jgi:hypothetical protein